MGRRRSGPGGVACAAETEGLRWASPSPEVSALRVSRHRGPFGRPAGWLRRGRATKGLPFPSRPGPGARRSWYLQVGARVVPPPGPSLGTELIAPGGWGGLPRLEKWTSLLFKRR